MTRQPLEDADTAAASSGNEANVANLGIGWRHPHYGELLERLPALDFLEVHSENFFATGGAALAVLEQGRAHYPISLHGVGLSLGSAAGLDDWHLDQLQRLVQHIDPVRVSDHASFARGVFKGAVVHAADLLPIPFSATSTGWFDLWLTQAWFIMSAVAPKMPRMAIRRRLRPIAAIAPGEPK